MNSPLLCDWLQQQWSFRRFSLWQYFWCSAEQLLQYAGVWKSFSRMFLRFSRADDDETSWSLKYSMNDPSAGLCSFGEPYITKLSLFMALAASAWLKSQSKNTKWRKILFETIILALWSFNRLCVVWVTGGGITWVINIRFSSLLSWTETRQDDVLKTAQLTLKILFLQINSKTFFQAQPSDGIFRPESSVQFHR